MKRLIALLLSLIFIFSLAPAPALAAAEPQGGYAAPHEAGTEAGPLPTAEPSTEPTAEPTPEPAIEPTAEPEPTEEPAEERSCFVTWQNPIYESVEFVPAQSRRAARSVMGEATARTYEAAVYSSVDAAASYVRSQMVNRNKSITLSYRSSDTAFTQASAAGKQSYINSLAMEIFFSAITHTGVSDQGDSLLYEIYGMGAANSWSGTLITVNIYITSSAMFTAWYSDPASRDADGNMIGQPTLLGYYTTAAQEQQLRAKIAEILSGLDLAGKSDFEKLRAIYAYICGNVSYDYGSSSGMLKYTAYAAALNGTAVCQGIAALFYRLALDSGVDARVIGSTAVSPPHAWSIARLDGAYYSLDATWDLGKGQNAWDWFLRGTDNFEYDGRHREESAPNGASTSDYSMSAADYVGDTVISASLFSVSTDFTDGAVYIDGVPYSLAADIVLPDAAAKSAVIYGYNTDPNSASDRHTVYPTSMYVWLLAYHNGSYTVTRASAFDNCLTYAGTAIRVTGVKGIRLATGIPTDMKRRLIGSGGYSGYTMVEDGTVVAWESELGSSPLIKGRANVKGNFAYNKSQKADPVYKVEDGLTKYTNVLTFTEMEKCAPDLVLRPYMIIKDADGVCITLYGGVLYRNIGYVAYQNRGAFSEGTAAYSYIWDILNAVYPDGYQP